MSNAAQAWAVLLKAEVFHERAADVADADQNGRVVAVHAEDLGDLAAQRHVVAMALLANSPKQLKS